jgi:hypothetical protein
MRWERVFIPAAPDGEPPALGTMRLTPPDPGPTLVLREVQVTADSVIGWRNAGGVPVRVALHRSRVAMMERYDANALETLGLMALAVVVALGAAALYALSTIRI